MDVTLALLIVLLVALGVGTCLLWRKYRRLTHALAEAERQSSGWSSLLALEHKTNYKMACALYGREAVDRAIRPAHQKGNS